MRILIADDDPLVCDLLRHHCLKLEPDADVIIAPDGQAALLALRASPCDLLLLDLDMPGTDGRELLDLITDDIPVIICTGDPHFAVKSYRYNVVDYLLKPVAFDRLAQAWRKLKDRDKPGQRGAEKDIVFVRTGTDIVRLRLSDVRFIKSDSNYVRFVLEGKDVASLMNMKDLEQKLPPSFVRVHRSYIVNLHHVEKLDSMDMKIGRDLIPVSETYRPDLLKRLDLL